MHQAGIENVVASSGTALTRGQIKLIHRFSENITVLYDGDAAGIKAALRGIDLLLSEGMNIKVVLLPEGEDPDSFARKQNATSFVNYIQENENDFVRFKANLLLDEAGDDPVKKAHLINEIVDTIALIPKEIVRLLYVKDCSKLLEMDERVLLRAISKKRREVREKQQTAVSHSASLPPIIAPPAPGPEKNEIENIHISDTYPFDPFEKDILRYVIRHGNRTLYWFAEEETEPAGRITVIEHIMQDLWNDELEFKNPVHKIILEEAYDRYMAESTFNPEMYFLNHPNPEISSLAVQLVSDKYPLSKIHSKFQQVRTEADRLSDIIPYVMLVYKEAILEKQINELNNQIKKLSGSDDFEKIIQLMKELTELKETQKLIAKHTGERIVRKM
jgi:DNA primase (bacterial type)